MGNHIYTTKKAYTFNDILRYSELCTEIGEYELEKWEKSALGSCCTACENNVNRVNAQSNYEIRNSHNYERVDHHLHAFKLSHNLTHKVKAVNSNVSGRCSQSPIVNKAHNDIRGGFKQSKQINQKLITNPNPTVSLPESKSYNSYLWHDREPAIPTSHVKCEPVELSHSIITLNNQEVYVILHVQKKYCPMPHIPIEEEEQEEESEENFNSLLTKTKAAKAKNNAKEFTNKDTSIGVVEQTSKSNLKDDADKHPHNKQADSANSEHYLENSENGYHESANVEKPLRQTSARNLHSQRVKMSLSSHCFPEQKLMEQNASSITINENDKDNRYDTVQNAKERDVNEDNLQHTLQTVPTWAKHLTLLFTPRGLSQPFAADLDKPQLISLWSSSPEITSSFTLSSPMTASSSSFKNAEFCNQTNVEECEQREPQRGRQQQQLQEAQNVYHTTYAYSIHILNGKRAHPIISAVAALFASELEKLIHVPHIVKHLYECTLDDLELLLLLLLAQKRECTVESEKADNSVHSRNIFRSSKEKQNTMKRKSNNKVSAKRGNTTTAAVAIAATSNAATTAHSVNDLTSSKNFTSNERFTSTSESTLRSLPIESEFISCDDFNEKETSTLTTSLPLECNVNSHTKMSSTAGEAFNIKNKHIDKNTRLSQSKFTTIGKIVANCSDNNSNNYHCEDEKNANNSRHKHYMHSVLNNHSEDDLTNEQQRRGSKKGQWKHTDADKEREWYDEKSVNNEFYSAREYNGEEEHKFNEHDYYNDGVEHQLEKPTFSQARGKESTLLDKSACSYKGQMTLSVPENPSHSETKQAVVNDNDTSCQIHNNCQHENMSVNSGKYAQNALLRILTNHCNNELSHFEPETSKLTTFQISGPVSVGMESVSGVADMLHQQKDLANNSATSNVQQERKIENVNTKEFNKQRSINKEDVEKTKLTSSRTITFGTPRASSMRQSKSTNKKSNTDISNVNTLAKSVTLNDVKQKEDNAAINANDNTCKKENEATITTTCTGSSNNNNNINNNNDKTNSYVANNNNVKEFEESEDIKDNIVLHGDKRATSTNTNSKSRIRNIGALPIQGPPTLHLSHPTYTKKPEEYNNNNDCPKGNATNSMCGAESETKTRCHETSCNIVADENEHEPSTLNEFSNTHSLVKNNNLENESENVRETNKEQESLIDNESCTLNDNVASTNNDKLTTNNLIYNNKNSMNNSIDVNGKYVEHDKSNSFHHDNAEKGIELEKEQHAQKENDNANDNVEDEDDEVRMTDDRVRKWRFASVTATEILPYLFVGGELPAKNKHLLLHLGITTIVNTLSYDIPNTFPTLFYYDNLYVSDSPDEPIFTLFPHIVHTIEDELQNSDNGRVYIHCHQGVSRSCTLVIAYLMWKNNWDYDMAYDFVRDRRNVCNPNAGFQLNLRLWHAHLHSAELRCGFAFLPYSDEYPLPFVYQFAVIFDVSVNKTSSNTDIAKCSIRNAESESINDMSNEDKSSIVSDNQHTTSQDDEDVQNNENRTIILSRPLIERNVQRVNDANREFSLDPEICYGFVFKSLTDIHTFMYCSRPVHSSVKAKAVDEWKFFLRYGLHLNYHSTSSSLINTTNATEIERNCETAESQLLENEEDVKSLVSKMLGWNESESSNTNGNMDANEKHTLSYESKEMHKNDLTRVTKECRNTCKQYKQGIDALIKFMEVERERIANRDRQRRTREEVNRNSSMMTLNSFSTSENKNESLLNKSTALVSADELINVAAKRISSEENKEDIRAGNSYNVTKSSEYIANNNNATEFNKQSTAQTLELNEKYSAITEKEMEKSQIKIAIANEKSNNKVNFEACPIIDASDTNFPLSTTSMLKEVSVPNEHQKLSSCTQNTNENKDINITGDEEHKNELFQEHQTELQSEQYRQHSDTGICHGNEHYCEELSLESERNDDRELLSSHQTNDKDYYHNTNHYQQQQQIQQEQQQQQEHHHHHHHGYNDQIEVYEYPFLSTAERNVVSISDLKSTKSYVIYIPAYKQLPSDLNARLFVWIGQCCGLNKSKALEVFTSNCCSLQRSEFKTNKLYKAITHSINKIVNGNESCESDESDVKNTSPSLCHRYDVKLPSGVMLNNVCVHVVREGEEPDDLLLLFDEKRLTRLKYMQQDEHKFVENDLFFPSLPFGI